MYLEHQVLLMESIEAHLDELSRIAEPQGAGNDQERV